MEISGLTCPGCGMMQMAGATCKSCGAALGAPSPPSKRSDRGVRQAPEVLRTKEYVPRDAWECGCGVTNGKGRKRCSGCGLLYGDAMYHTRQAELYGYSPTLRQNRLDWLDRFLELEFMYDPFFVAALSPLVLLIRGLSRKERAGDSRLLGKQEWILVYLGITYFVLLLPFVVYESLGDAPPEGIVVTINVIFYYPLAFAYAIATFPASILAVAVAVGGANDALILVAALLPLINVGLVYGLVKWVRPSR